MAKTSIEIDDGKLKTVRAILGTQTKRETVDAALDDVIRRRRREQLVERLKAMEGLDFDDEQVMAEAWR
jgi:Arc/MetJ family transcription regulator